MRYDSNLALQAFAKVACFGSFTRAAAELEVTPSALSQTLRQLETQLGVRLLNRTTRKVSLTEAGEGFLARIAPALAAIDAAIDDVRQQQGKPTGTLRLTMARSAYQFQFAPLLNQFMSNYPHIHLDLDVANGLVDIVEQGFAAGIRLGEALQRDMVAVPISPPQRFVVVGAPDYLARHGLPKHPTELQQHACLRIRYVTSGAVHRWEFEQGDKRMEVAVEGPLTANDSTATLQGALAGLGLAYVLEAQAAEHLAAGQLQSVLDDWLAPADRYYLYYSSRAQLPPKLRVLIDFLREQP
jgi:DNA-binding transcriptional LysR family regulator